MPALTRPIPCPVSFKRCSKDQLQASVVLESRVKGNPDSSTVLVQYEDRFVVFGDSGVVGLLRYRSNKSPDPLNLG